MNTTIKFPWNGRSETEWLAWAAGFFDGEGSVRVENVAGRYLTIRITATQVTKEPIEILQALLGGSIRLHRRPNSKYRPTWNWYASAKSALAALERLEPYVVAKHEQVRLAIQFQRGITRRGYGVYTPEEHQRRLAIRDKIKILNGRIP